MDLWMISLTSGKAPSCRWFSRSQLTESQIRAWSISTPSNFCAAQRTLATKAVNLLSEGIRLLACLIHSYIFCFFSISMLVCLFANLLGWPVCLPQCLSVYLSTGTFAYLPVCLSVCPSIYLPERLPACLFIYLSAETFAYLPVCLSTCLSVCLSSLSGCLSFHPSTCLPTYPSVCLSVGPVCSSKCFPVDGFCSPEYFTTYQVLPGRCSPNALKDLSFLR